MTQVIWETVVTSKSIGKTPEPACWNTAASQKSSASKCHPPNRPKGGDKRMHRDTKRNRHIHQLCRDRHADKWSCRRPYAEILAQNYDQPANCSDDDQSFSDHSSVHSHNALDSDSAPELLSGSATQNITAWNSVAELPSGNYQLNPPLYWLLTISKLLSYSCNRKPSIC